MVRAWKRDKILARAGLVILMGACALAMSASRAQATLIDHFTEVMEGASWSITAGPTPGAEATVVETGLSSVLGGNRTTMIHFVTDGNVRMTRASLAPADQHVLFFSNDADVIGWMKLTYDGMENYDYTDGGLAYAIEFRLKHSDLALTATIAVTSSIYGTSSVVVAMPSGGPTEFVVPFTSFSVPAAFTDMDSIEFLFDPGTTRDVDLSIDAITQRVVPEPVTMLGVFLGIGSVGAYIRKRRMA
jgi:hypothetical protein